MGKGGKGKGKGLGKGKDGGAASNRMAGGRGGNNNTRKRTELWQCRRCDDKVRSAGAFCTGCGGSKSACKRPTANIPDPNLDKYIEESKKIRKEFEDFRKDVQKRVTEKAPDKKPGEGGPRIDPNKQVLQEIISLNQADLPESTLHIGEGGTLTSRK